jgi:hypothetical protein
MNEQDFFVKYKFYIPIPLRQQFRQDLITLENDTLTGLMMMGEPTLIQSEANKLYQSLMMRDKPLYNPGSEQRPMGNTPEIIEP